MNTPVVPFGKYKGQPVEVLLADDNYREWLLAQPWFEERFRNVYNVVINYGGEPQDTPEHNALQARFLDPEFCTAIAKAVTSPERFDECWNKDLVVENLSRLSEVTVEEDSPVVGSDIKFEVSGWDVVFGLKGGLVASARLVDCDYECRADGKACHHFDKRERVYRKKMIPVSNDYAVECKPVLGDDYPSVMRQIKGHVKPKTKDNPWPYRPDLMILLVGSFSAVGATLVQAKSIFLSGDIRLVTLDEVSKYL